MPAEYFLLAGAQRSGTTLLYRLLDQHPEIAMARPLRPEPKFFLCESAAPVRLDDYRRLFEKKTGAHVFGEKSTSYMERADVGPAAISLLGDAKAVFLLRDPVQRAISNYRFSVENGIETAPLKEAIFNEEARASHYDRATVSVSPFAYVARGHYYKFIERWEAAIGLERIRLLVFEQLIASRGVLGELFRWLGVSGSFEPDIPPVPVNQSTIDTDVAPDVQRYLAERFQESNRILHERYGVDVSLWQSAHEAILR